MSKKKQGGLSEVDRSDVQGRLLDLNVLLDERIRELKRQEGNWIGAVQARHAYTYYRELILETLKIVSK